MITAKEAKELFEVSDTIVDQFLDVIDPAIRNAAIAGKKELCVSSIVTLPDHSKVGGSIGPFDRLEITPFQQRLIDKLVSYGFGAKLELYGNKYVPRGLADDDNHGPEHQNYTIIVRW